MRKTFFVVVFSIITMMASAGHPKQPYYGFYPSERGLDHKLFRHNIFNFEIDIPNSWIFGVAGKAPGQVIIMYPEGLNTAIFSPSYVTISIGIIPTQNISLDIAYKKTLLGMQKHHNDLNIIQDKINVEINGNKAVNFLYEWLSKTENSIKESIFLVEYGKRIYSIAIRTIDPISKDQKKRHENIVNTFKPIKPVDF